MTTTAEQGKTLRPAEEAALAKQHRSESSPHSRSSLSVDVTDKKRQAGRG